MRQLTALAWKEWREVRWVIATALVTFVAFPIIEGIEGRGCTHRFVFAASPWVMFLGGILTIVVGATSLTRDLDRRLADFWQSRPVATWRWLATKYLVGLAVVISSCLIPLLIEAWLYAGDPRSTHFAATLAAWFPFIIAVQYSLGFVCGATMRKGGTAIMLALAVSLLIYCLPILLSPLRSLDVSNSLANSSTPKQHVLFALAAIVLTAALLAFAILAIVREWQVRAAQKVTYWSIGGGILLAFASAALHLGTNLPVLQTFDVEHSDLIVPIAADAHHGCLTYIKQLNKRSLGNTCLRAIEIDNGAIRLGPEIVLKEWPAWQSREVRWMPSHPEFAFLVKWSPVSDQSNKVRFELVVMNLQSPTESLVATVELATGDANEFNVMPLMQSIGGELYVKWWKHAVLVDVSNPAHPLVKEAQPFLQYALSDDGASPTLGVALLSVEGVPLQERLAASVAFSGNPYVAVIGDILITARKGAFSTFRMSRIHTRSFTEMDMGRMYTQSFRETNNAVKIDTVAEFRRIGGYEPSILGNIIGDTPVALAAAGNLLYVSSRSQSFGMSLAHVVVFDLADPVHPRPIGHFAAPHEEQLQLCPLPDGRLLAGGHKFYVVGAPPHHQ